MRLKEFYGFFFFSSSATLVEKLNAVSLMKHIVLLSLLEFRYFVEILTESFFLFFSPAACLTFAQTYGRRGGSLRTDTSHGLAAELAPATGGRARQRCGEMLRRAHVRV